MKLTIKDRVTHSQVVPRFLVTASVSYAWSSLKNCVKILLGRKPYFDERGSFLRQYVLHLLGVRPIRKITCTGLPLEGAGSQALMIMNAINFARAAGLTYMHTPFTVLRHAARPMSEWAAAWETFFNLGAGENVCESDRRDAVNFCFNFPNLDLCLGWRGREDDLARHFKTMIPEFRRKYYLNKSPRQTTEVTVAVHIRRGNASPDDPSYYTHNEAVLRTLTAVKSMLETRGAGYRICVYSEGDRADFGEMSMPGVEFFLDIDAVWTMQELIEADVLIMAKGFFSYCAGLISDGIKICEAMPISDDLLPGWRWRDVSPADDWITAKSDGSFNAATFERQLARVIQSKTMIEAKRARSTT